MIESIQSLIIQTSEEAIIWGLTLNIGWAIIFFILFWFCVWGFNEFNNEKDEPLQIISFFVGVFCLISMFFLGQMILKICLTPNIYILEKYIL